jgi:hypothetical protein
MLMTDKTARAVYGSAMPEGFKFPRKGQKAVLMQPIIWPEGIVIIWTEHKSPDGKRLFNCGLYRADDTAPDYFKQ